MIVVLMGVSGAGKTTVGQALARQLQWRFADADDFHSAANVAKMHAGIPLTDADRAPWLAALHQAIVSWLAAHENVVLACSALKATYRAQIVVSPEVKLIYLRVGREVVAVRLAHRQHHYMNPALIDSQFATLEEPADAVAVDASLTTKEVVLNIRRALAL
ncbi:MAG TPA: gluconokinase [Verrucomicrobiae bacterium]|jgi:gluconokinase|nr:gluconokinase [Verrucomicrobiae bacterium]